MKRQESGDQDERSKAKAKATYDRWFRGIQKGYERIMATPDASGQPNRKQARIRWVLKLLSVADLDAMGEAEYENLQYEIEFFLSHPGADPENSSRIFSLPDNGGELSHLELPTKTEVRKILDWLMQSVDAILNQQPFGYVQPTGKREMVWCAHPPFPGSNGGWLELTRYHDFDQDWMLEDFFEVLKAHAADITKCPSPDCHRIFVRDRSNQKFCSKKCQERQAKRDQHSIPPERYGKRGRPRVDSTTDLPQPTKGGTHGKKIRPR